MTARMIEVHDGWRIRGGRLRRVVPTPDQLLLDRIRTLVIIALVVLAMAGMVGLGALVGAAGMPLGGPAPGFP